MSESIYILKRKIKARICSLLFYFFRLMPIDDELVTVCSFEGKLGYCCNPKYLVEELHRRDKKFKFVWFVNDVNREFPNYVKKVPNNAFSRAYWLSKSKIWIDNYRKPLGTKKRKGQIYINTWHGTLGFKPIGLMRGDLFSSIAYLVSKNDSDMIDYVTIDSDFAESIFPQGMIYNGKFLKYGNPRYDALCRNKIENRANLLRRHGISDNVKVVLYAPTFREGEKCGKRKVFSQNWTINFGQLIRTLEQRFGGTWQLCIRVHPQIAGLIDEELGELGVSYINESNTDDMYEIINAVDAFVTDYSGAAFEAALINIPVFLYADDVRNYIEKRGELIWNIGTEFGEEIHNNQKYLPDMSLVLPFSFADSNDALVKNIMNFNNKEYIKRVNDFKSKTNVIIDGKACCNIVDDILSSV